MTTAPAPGLDPALDRSSSVDAALRAWRSETVERRAAWDAEQAELEAELKARRRWATIGLVSGAGFGALVFSAAVGLYLWLGPTSVAPTHAPPIAEASASADILEPVVEVASASSPSLGLLGDVREWRRGDGLWVQFDYTGTPLVLKWLDAAGNEALERTPCVNNVGAGVRRCYVGRTARRVEMARAAGATPGTWTAEACRAGHCATVARYTVD